VVVVEGLVDVAGVVGVAEVEGVAGVVEADDGDETDAVLSPLPQPQPLSNPMNDSTAASRRRARGVVATLKPAPARSGATHR
jgi:hypothetical protein